MAYKLMILGYYLLVCILFFIGVISIDTLVIVAVLNILLAPISVEYNDFNQ